MIKIFKASVLLLISVFVISCDKEDEPAEVVVVPYEEQYPKDLANIEKFLKTHKIEVIDNPSGIDHRDVKFTIVNEGDVNSIMLQTEYPLLSKIVKSNGVDYKVYYLNITKKDNVAYDSNYFGENNSPSRVDSVFVSYRGEYIYEKKEEVVPATNPVTYNKFITGKQFDQAQNPVWFPLEGVIQGWKEILPLFKTGTSTGVNAFSDFGAGVMFLPSGLAYYRGAAGISPYTPLIFSFKLKTLSYIDHDLDGIDSKDEDINGNGIFTDDDTDGDGIQNYYDKDDDGDGYTTISERKYTKTDTSTDPNTVYTFYYPYNGAAVDDPATLFVDETQGIPRAFTGPLLNPSLPESATNRRQPIPSDFTDPLRLRRHLDKTSKPPYL